MDLKKRDCPIKIRLTPSTAHYFLIELEIGGDAYSFLPSSAIGLLFGDFMAAVYQLYTENNGMDCHNEALLQDPGLGYSRRILRDREKAPTLKEGELFVETGLTWDEEGPMSHITLSRNVPDHFLRPRPDGPDPVTVTIEREDHDENNGVKTYVVEGKDLCYAIGRACTEAMKKYGFYGYFFSAGKDSFAEWIDINQLLFFKAYALNAMEVRDFSLIDVGGNITVHATDFEKELELLLFDM